MPPAEDPSKLGELRLRVACIQQFWFPLLLCTAAHDFISAFGPKSWDPGRSIGKASPPRGAQEEFLEIPHVKTVGENELQKKRGGEAKRGQPPSR